MAKQTMKMKHKNHQFAFAFGALLLLLVFAGNSNAAAAATAAAQAAATATATSTTAAVGATTCNNEGGHNENGSSPTTCDNNATLTTSTNNNNNNNMTATAQISSSSSSSVSTTTTSSSSSTCTIVEVLSSEWIVAGHDLNQGDVMSQPDVVVPFRIHNRHTTWPLWRRHHYFWPLLKDNDNVHDKDWLMFAPGLGSHLSCHNRLHNVQYTVPSIPVSFLDDDTNNNNNKPYSTFTSEPLRAARMIARGDPLAIPCRDQDLSSQAMYNISDVNNFHFDKDNDDDDDEEEAERHFCWQPLVVGPSTVVVDVGSSSSSSSSGQSSNKNIMNVGQGAFSTGHYKPGDIVTYAPMIHMHRNELRNSSANNDPYELLLNYAYGHPHSALLLLPSSPVVNYINHASDDNDDDDDDDDATSKQQQQLLPNVKVKWHMGFRSPKDANRFFNGPMEKMLYQDEATQLEVVYRAIRDIAPGDEILMDYGSDWQQAWNDHVESCRSRSDSKDKDMNETTTTTCMAQFRHEIGVPEFFFPPQWLAKQKEKWDQEKSAAALTTTKKQWDLSPVKPGEIRRVQVQGTGEEPMKHVYRIGLPPQLAPKMLDFAHRMGIVQILYDYVKDGGNPMEKDGTERHRINGGTWWAKRFDAVWKSNMHYITPDDDKANADMLAALKDAGWHDQVLSAIGKKFGLTGLMSYYMSFIAVTHCTGSALHDDAAEGDAHFNVIFPLIQVPNSTQPELLLGADAPDHHDPYSSKMILPYTYEPEAAVCLGGRGLHSTGPIDYRGLPPGAGGGGAGGHGHPQNWRLGLTIYIVDVNNFTVHAITDGWHEPPYPYNDENFTRAEFFWKHAARDWKAAATAAADPSTATPAVISTTTSTA